MTTTADWPGPALVDVFFVGAGHAGPATSSPERVAVELQVLHRRRAIDVADDDPPPFRAARAGPVQI